MTKNKLFCFGCHYHRIANALIFAFLFIFTGWAIPQIFFSYFDTTNYYEVLLPVRTDALKYNTCDTAKLYITRNSKIDAKARVILELVDIYENTEVTSETRPLSIEKGRQTITALFKLPCDLQGGTYYIRGLVTYEVRGVDKNTKIYTTNFTVLR